MNQAELIADVAERYEVPMIKITGGQRIDLLGVKKHDLPGVWRDLGMPAGHAWGKSYRTCKSCIGTDYCRFGLGDSLALATKIENRCRGIDPDQERVQDIARDGAAAPVSEPHRPK